MTLSFIDAFLREKLPNFLEKAATDANTASVDMYQINQAIADSDRLFISARATYESVIAVLDRAIANSSGAQKEALAAIYADVAASLVALEAERNEELQRLRRSVDSAILETRHDGDISATGELVPLK